MTAKRTGRLPRSIVGLWLIVPSLEKSEIPDSVRRIATAVKKATVTDDGKPVVNPKPTLNRAFAVLRRRDRAIFARLEEWLWRPDVRRWFIKKGHGPTLHRWVRASAGLQRKEVATQALGLSKGGPPQKHFSVYHDAAFYAEYLTRVEGLAAEKATMVAQRLGGRKLDRRELQRRRKRLWRFLLRSVARKNRKGDRKDPVLRYDRVLPLCFILRDQYEVIARKYRLR